MRSRGGNSPHPADMMARLKERLLIEIVVRNRFPSKYYGFSIPISLERKSLVKANAEKFLSEG